LYLSNIFLKQLSSLLKKSVSVFLILLTIPASAGDLYHLPAGAGEAGMGSVCIMKIGFWSSFHNQALLAYNRLYSAGINYENRFNISELGTRMAGIVIPAGRASLGIVYSHFGYSYFRREMGGVACGLALGKKIAAGIQVDYFSEKTTGEYDNFQSVTCEAGLTVKPQENIMIGLHIFNPVPNSVRKISLPTSIRAGAGIELSKVLFAGAEAEMSSGKELLLRTGFEYEAARNFKLRGGFCTENTSFSFGLGYLLKFLKLDLSFVTHEKLGFSSSCSLIFKIK
jgi:hypothetical protein